MRLDELREANVKVLMDIFDISKVQSDDDSDATVALAFQSAVLFGTEQHVVALDPTSQLVRVRRPNERLLMSRNTFMELIFRDGKQREKRTWCKSGLWTLLSILGHQEVFKIFNVLLAERPVILVSEDPVCRTLCCEALMAMLLPLTYKFPYIPSLPFPLARCAGRFLGSEPYLVGLHPHSSKVFEESASQAISASTGDIGFRPTVIHLDEAWVQYGVLPSVLPDTLPFRTRGVAHGLRLRFKVYFRRTISHRRWHILPMIRSC